MLISSGYADQFTVLVKVPDQNLVALSVVDADDALSSCEDTSEQADLETTDAVVLDNLLGPQLATDASALTGQFIHLTFLVNDVGGVRCFGFDVPRSLSG